MEHQGIRGCSNNHIHGWVSLPVKEECEEQKEDDQFIFHTLPLNSKFTDTFKLAWSELEIFLPILCFEQKTHGNVTCAQTSTTLSVCSEICSSKLETEIKIEGKKMRKEQKKMGKVWVNTSFPRKHHSALQRCNNEPPTNINLKWTAWTVQSSAAVQMLSAALTVCKPSSPSQSSVVN